MRTYDVALIGAGPMGLELAVHLNQSGIDYVHFEAGQIGSTIDWYAPGTVFFSSPERIAIAGVPLEVVEQRKASREEYLNYLRGVVRQFDLDVETYTRLVRVERNTSAEFLLHTESSEHGFGGPAEVERQSQNSRASDDVELVSAKRLVLAIGDLHLPFMLDIPGEDLPHVSHYLGDVHQYFRRRVLIVGGKNSAVEAAIRLYRLGADVSVAYRGEAFDPKRVKFWLLPELKGLIRKQRIAFHPMSVPTQIEHDAVTLRHLETGAEERVAADSVLLLTGYRQDSTLYESLGVELEGERKKPQYNERTMETNVPGLYVCGNAAAGTQSGGVKEFIETGHVHVPRIIASLLGESPPTEEEESSWMLET